MLNDQGSFIGVTGLDLRPDTKAEFGWYLSPAWWNHGYATAVTATLLRFGFVELGVPAMTATCDPSNEASRRVLEKSGLKLVGQKSVDTWQGERPRLQFEISKTAWSQPLDAGAGCS